MSDQLIKLIEQKIEDIGGEEKLQPQDIEEIGDLLYNQLGIPKESNQDIIELLEKADKKVSDD